MFEHIGKSGIDSNSGLHQPDRREHEDLYYSDFCQTHQNSHAEKPSTCHGQRQRVVHRPMQAFAPLQASELGFTPPPASKRAASMAGIVVATTRGPDPAAAGAGS